MSGTFPKMFLNRIQHNERMSKLFQYLFENPKRLQRGSENKQNFMILLKQLKAKMVLHKPLSLS